MRKVQWTYDVHPGVAMVQSAIAAMKKKTGRSFDEWMKLIKQEAPSTEKERREWLKAKHGMGTNDAAWIAACSVGKGEDGDPERYLREAYENVDKMFSGPKEELRPIYDELLKMGKALGEDVKVCPCQTIVPLYRNHVFAQVKPSTRTRIDFGLALKDTKTPKRLIDTGGFAKKDRITHRFEIFSVDEIDDEVRRWTRKAYEMDAAKQQPAK
ncbi:MAG TPA: DUF5655 domain-containing protein [Candidatus Angelobacter sp.]|nr:DUF5655 domain-containing protein [Candidatus Angelobacter sp.]